jgi:phosphoribosyl 1,2-cyclic phosphate phosphodiesterase
MGFDDLRRFTVREEEEIAIFATEECLERLHAAFTYVFDGENRYRGYLKAASHVIRGPFQIGDLEVTPLPVTHGKVETIGFLFSKGGVRLFAYIPDAKELHEESKRLLAGIDLLILDGLQPEPHWTHLSTGEAAALAGELCARSTWLTHFSCRVDYRTLEPTLPESVRLAWDGLKLWC